tara:strand:+ start:993 stop:1382 length:390 start_codon:yes stop_codon:yes gene_type:complete
MDNRIIGIFISVITIYIAITLYDSPVSFFEKTAMFFSFPSMVIVLGVGGGMTYMGKHLLKSNEVGENFKKNLITAGWIGFMMGLVSLGSGIHEEGGTDNIAGGLAAAGLTVLYGYLAGYIARAFVTQKH